jgi:hypothetical protein
MVGAPDAEGVRFSWKQNRSNPPLRLSRKAVIKKNFGRNYLENLDRCKSPLLPTG